MHRAPGALPIIRVMPFASQPRAEQATATDKRRLAVAGAVLVLVLAGIGIWAAVRPGSYGASRDGCVTVTLPSTTGGGLIHECGTAAKTMCRHAFAAGDKVSMLTRPQCRLAGLAP
jgi:hypothetical protein